MQRTSSGWWPHHGWQWLGIFSPVIILGGLTIAWAAVEAEPLPAPPPPASTANLPVSPMPAKFPATMAAKFDAAAETSGIDSHSVATPTFPPPLLLVSAAMPDDAKTTMPPSLPIAVVSAQETETPAAPEVGSNEAGRLSASQPIPTPPPRQPSRVGTTSTVPATRPDAHFPQPPSLDGEPPAPGRNPILASDLQSAESVLQESDIKNWATLTRLLQFGRETGSQPWSGIWNALPSNAQQSALQLADKPDQIDLLSEARASLLAGLNQLLTKEQLPKLLEFNVQDVTHPLFSEMLIRYDSLINPERQELHRHLLHLSMPLVVSGKTTAELQNLARLYLPTPAPFSEVENPGEPKPAEVIDLLVTVAGLAGQLRVTTEDSRQFTARGDQPIRLEAYNTGRLRYRFPGDVEPFPREIRWNPTAPNLLIDPNQPNPSKPRQPVTLSMATEPPAAVLNR